jgi:hypothetical protein
MQLRFTLSHNATPVLPALSDWISQVVGTPGTAWTTGAAPTVTVPGAFLSPASSDHLCTPDDIEFEVGVEYTISVTYTKVYNIVDSNPRQFFIGIYNSAFSNVPVANSELTPASPGGTKTSTITFVATPFTKRIGIVFTDGSNVTYTINSIAISGGTDSLVINTPDGWKEAEINFARHPDLHSVRPSFNTPFDFYGKNIIGGIDGGRDFILKMEKKYGPDAVIGVLVERSTDGFTWKTLAEQEFPISGPFSEKVGVDHRVESTFTDKSFWAKFISRFETPVNINATTNEDGGEADVVAPIDLTLTSQKIPQNFFGESDIGIHFANVDNGDFIQFDHDIIKLDEIEERFSLGSTLMGSLPSWHFAVKFDGDYTFDVKRECSLFDTELPDIGYRYSDSWLDWYIRKNDEDPILFNHVNVGTEYVDGRTLYSYAGTQTLKAGDVIRIYGFFHTNIADFNMFNVWGYGGSDGINNVGVFTHQNYPGTNPNPSYTSILANTTYPDTQIQADLIHDLGAKICDRITGVNDSFYSEVLGSPYTVARTYAEAGIYWEYAHAKALQIRGYTLTEKPFFASMRDYWQGINPIFNLGMGIKKINGADKIYIGKKEEFYPTDRVSVRLSGVYKITRMYDADHQFNVIQNGYEKGEIEDISGLDDWLRVNRATIFKKIGKKLVNLSKMIGTSLTWEHARRTTRVKSADYKYDNDIFIVNVKRVEGEPYVPALNEEFDAVTGLLNEATRYNKKLTPARNFLRWINYYSGCIQAYLSSTFRFAGGEGNYDMTSEMIDNGDVESFGGAVLSEKQNIPVSTDFIFLPMPYKIEHYVTFSQLEAMLADPEAAIEISQTQTGHKPFFIKSLSVQLATGKITGELWPKEFMELQVVNKPSRVFSDEFGGEFG